MELKKYEGRNDLVKGLKLNVTIPQASTPGAKKAAICFTYEGKYGQGYDGCGSHTHKD